MGKAREVMDRVTDAMINGDSAALGALYAPDAVAETPDRGTIRGHDEIVAYLGELRVAFPDASWEGLHKFEIGDTAIDEGYFIGTNSGPIAGSGGESIPATGKSVRIRECDVATVEDGFVTSHRFYFDVLGYVTQLGLGPAPAGGGEAA